MLNVKCSYCGSHLHDIEYCLKTWNGQGNRVHLKCNYCGSKKHNTDACKSKWPGPNPKEIYD
jgi:hypothetical protein